MSMIACPDCYGKFVDIGHLLIHTDIQRLLFIARLMSALTKAAYLFEWCNLVVTEA